MKSLRLIGTLAVLLLGVLLSVAVWESAGPRLVVSGAGPLAPGAAPFRQVET